MRNQAQLIFGCLLLLFGLLALLSSLLDVDFGALCWPVLLILIGAGILLRPRWLKAGTKFRVLPFGEERRSGAWQVTDEEIWGFIGNTRLDLREAVIPEGETVIRIYGFIGDVELLLPQNLGVFVSSNALINSTEILGRKQDVLLTSVEYQSEGYQSAERKIRLETLFFILDLDIEQP